MFTRPPGPWTRFALVALAVSLTGGAAYGQDTAAKKPMGKSESASPGSAAGEMGQIAGVVTYRADAARPWRYVRYYVQKPKTGELAEALVALRGRSLKQESERPKTVVIDQKLFNFTPEIAAIRVGDSIKFTNSDQSPHNVQTSGEIANFNVNMPADGEHLVKFDRAGGIRLPARVGCVFHSSMRAWIFVFDHPYYAITAADGKFRLENVPPGEYDMELTHPAGSLRWRQKVVVKAGTTTEVNISLSPDQKE